jgi:hypothetical protein
MKSQATAVAVSDCPPLEGFDAELPSRFDYAYALVDAIQGDSRGETGVPLHLAVEYLGHVASSVYVDTHYANDALRGLQKVREVQTGA